MNPESPEAQVDACYLTDLSPKDKPWDNHKFQSHLIAKLLYQSVHDRLAGRIDRCSGNLLFDICSDPETGEQRFRLKGSRFCRVRQCPICQWRRSLMWIARFLKALPRITAAHPKCRWVMLTLTVKNCELVELRSTLDWMGEAWKRLTNRQVWPALGFARSTEVSRAWDCYHSGKFLGRHGVTWARKWEKTNPGKKLELKPTTEVHPHFHALLLVRSSYFTHGYISQEKWSELWRECLRVPYTPIVHVTAIKPNQKRLKAENNGQPVNELDAIAAGAVEVFKYSVKPEDLFGNGREVDQQWLVDLVGQLHKTRAIALGGVLKDFMSEAEPEDLIGEDENGDLADYSLWFTWREAALRYIKRD